MIYAGIFGRRAK